MTLKRPLLLCVCLHALASLASTARSEPLEHGTVERSSVRERLSAALELRLGATTAPYFTRAFPEVRGHGVVALLHAGYRITERYSAGAALALLALSVEQPAGSYVDEFVSGNLDMFFRHDHALLDTPRLRLTMNAGAAVALPIAERSRSASLLPGRALRIGSALDGFRHPELYTQGVLPIAASIAVRLERRWLGAEASLRLPLLIRFSAGDLPEHARTRPLGVVPIVHFGLSADRGSWLKLALSADTVFDALPAVETTRAAPLAQLTLSPAITFRLPRAVELGASFVLPVAGALGQTTYAGSIVLGYRPAPLPGRTAAY
jgi:hypothetical protein